MLIESKTKNAVMNLSVTIASPSYEIWFQSVKEWRKYYFVYLYT